jgi:hypothetical protein
MPPPNGGLALAGAGGGGVLTAASATSVKVLADGTIVIVGPTLGMAMSVQGQGNGGSDDDATPVDDDDVTLVEPEGTVTTPSKGQPTPNNALGTAKPSPVAAVPAAAAAGMALPNMPGYVIRGVAKLGGRPVHEVIVVETPTGTVKAFYRRSGRGEGDDFIPVDPKTGKPILYGSEAGDWVPTEGAAITLSGIELSNKMLQYGISAGVYTSPNLPKAPSGNASATDLLTTRGARVEELGGDVFVLKPRVGTQIYRPGKPGDIAENGQVSRALDGWNGEFPSQALDARGFNDWLRSLGVQVGGNYSVGEIIFGEWLITLIP